MDTADTTSSSAEVVCCSFCSRSYKDVGPLVEAPEKAAWICHACARTVLDEIESRGTNRIRDMAVGISIFLALLVLGALVTWHGFATDGGGSLLAWTAIGIILVFGCLPMYAVVFRAWYPFGRSVGPYD